MFSCEICEEGLQEYAVTFFDFTKAGLCADCLAMEEKDNRVLLSQRYAGLK